MLFSRERFTRSIIPNLSVVAGPLKLAERKMTCLNSEKCDLSFTPLTGICTENPQGGGEGTCQNLDKDARPIFLGLKFGQILFFWVGKFFSYFSGFCKISAIFLGLKPLNEEHTVLKNKIIVAFYIYSNFDNHCILSHSIFLGLNFGAKPVHR